MTREDLTQLDLDPFRIAAPELPVRGALDSRNRRSQRMVRLETRDGSSNVVLEAAFWEVMKGIAGHSGLDLSSHAGQEFAKRLENFVKAASRVVAMANFGQGVREYRDKNMG